MARSSLKRRHTIRVIVIALLTYLGYLSITKFRLVNDVPSPAQTPSKVTDSQINLSTKAADFHSLGKLSEKPASHSEHGSTTTQQIEVVKSYAEYDNMVEYSKIMLNGANGQRLNVNESQLGPEDKIKHAEGWDMHQFNKYVSDMIPLNRSLPDVRLPR